MKPDLPATGVFSTGDALRIKPAPNGGYVLEAHNGRPDMMPALIGAYSNKADLLTALGSVLQ